jgi:hypothetical protein
MNVSRHLACCVVLSALAIVMCGCASIGAPVPPSLELPRPPTDLRAVRMGSKVYLTWSVPTKTTDRQNVRRPGPTRVCRSLNAIMSQCDVPVGNLAPTQASAELPHGEPGKKMQAEFVDTLPLDVQQQNPTRMATYAVEPLNLDARSAGLSNQVQVALAPTLSPPENIKAQVLSDGVVLTWDCETFPIEPTALRYVYRIYRRSPQTGADVKLSDETCPGGRYEDHTIEWQKNYEYRIAVVTFVALELNTHPCPSSVKTEDGVTTITNQSCEIVAEIQGDDSAPVKVFTNDVFPPAVPTGLQAVFSGPGQPPFIDLVWAPDTDADLAGYNVYRRDEGSQPTRVNTDLVKSSAFRDTKIAPGKTYFYTVSAVDLHGNESAHSDEASETVPKD